MAKRWLGRTWLFEPWRTRVLWLSVAGNMFCAALLLGPLVMQRPGPPSLERAVERMARDLPAQDSARFLSILAVERPWYEQARHRMELSRVELSRSIARTPYDEAEVRARMLEFQARWLETSSRFGESLLVALATLSPEGRARLADVTQRPRP